MCLATIKNQRPSRIRFLDQTYNTDALFAHVDRFEAGLCGWRGILVRLGADADIQTFAGVVVWWWLAPIGGHSKTAAAMLDGGAKAGARSAGVTRKGKREKQDGGS